MTINTDTVPNIINLYLDEHSQLHSKYRLYSVLCRIIND